MHTNVRCITLKTVLYGEEQELSDIAKCMTLCLGQDCLSCSVPSGAETKDAWVLGLGAGD